VVGVAVVGSSDHGWGGVVDGRFDATFLVVYWFGLVTDNCWLLTDNCWLSTDDSWFVVLDSSLLVVYWGVV